MRTALGFVGKTALSDGVIVYECTTDQQVIDLVRGGQGVFGVAIGQVWTDVQATLTHLPTETPGIGVGEATVRPGCAPSAGSREASSA